MKPCPNNRPRLAWLVLAALEPDEARSLRAHLESCAGCRQYFAELSSVSQNLAAAQAAPDETAAPSTGFHGRVIRALAAKPAEGPLAACAARAWATLSDWRLGVPTVGTAGLALILAVWLFHRPAPPLTSVVAQAPSPPVPAESAPTLANYQRVANQSLEALDDLLARQASHLPPAAPVYTAALFAVSDNGSSRAANQP